MPSRSSCSTSRTITGIRSGIRKRCSATATKYRLTRAVRDWRRLDTKGEREDPSYVLHRPGKIPPTLPEGMPVSQAALAPCFTRTKYRWPAHKSGSRCAIVDKTKPSKKRVATCPIRPHSKVCVCRLTQSQAFFTIGFSFWASGEKTYTIKEARQLVDSTKSNMR